MVPNVVTYNVLTMICKKSNQLELALEVFQAMQRQGTVPDAISLDSLILACSASAA